MRHCSSQQNGTTSISLEIKFVLYPGQGLTNSCHFFTSGSSDEGSLSHLQVGLLILYLGMNLSCESMFLVPAEPGTFLLLGLSFIKDRYLVWDGKV